MLAIMRMVVVLPEPFGPMKPYTEPSGTVRERSSTAVTAPKVLVTCEICTASIDRNVTGCDGTHRDRLTYGFSMLCNNSWTRGSVRKESKRGSTPSHGQPRIPLRMGPSRESSARGEFPSRYRSAPASTAKHTAAGRRSRYASIRQLRTRYRHRHAHAPKRPAARG